MEIRICISNQWLLQKISAKATAILYARPDLELKGYNILA